MKEVFIAKNGRPYVKDENGKVRFISDAEWEQHKTTKEDRKNMVWLLGVVSILVAIYIANNGGLI